MDTTKKKVDIRSNLKKVIWNKVSLRQHILATSVFDDSQIERTCNSSHFGKWTEQKH